MTMWASDLQSDSDLDSIRNSCDVFLTKVYLFVPFLLLSCYVVHLHYNANFSDQCVTQTSTCLSMQIVLPAACFAQREIIVTKTWLQK